jgi:hypothetical protein
MDRLRLFHGVLATVGGLVLLESLFLPWYGLEVTVNGVSAGNSQNAWQTMSAMDLLLFLTGLAAVAGGLLTVRSAEFAVVALLAGAAGVLCSLLGLLDLPDAGISAVPGDTVAVERKIGPFVALVASVGVAYAGFRVWGARLPAAR